MRTARARILCVDNDPTVCEWMREDLRTSNFDCSVTAADSGRPAITLLFCQAFDLCVMDYALPDMTGIQLCHLLRRIGYSVPIMIFTPLDRQIDREKATAAGANEFLRKPDDLDAFSIAVKRLLAVRRLFNTRNETISSLTQAVDA